MMQIQSKISKQLHIMGAHIYNEMGATSEAFGLIDGVENTQARREVLTGAWLAIATDRLGDKAAYEYKYWENEWKNRGAWDFGVAHANAYRFSCEIINASRYPEQSGIDRELAVDLLKEVAGTDYTRAVRDAIENTATPKNGERREFLKKVPANKTFENTSNFLGEAAEVTKLSEDALNDIALNELGKLGRSIPACAEESDEGDWGRGEILKLGLGEGFLA